MLGNGRYVVLASDAGTQVVDDSTGISTPLVMPIGCGGLPWFAGEQLAFGCDGLRVALYQPASGAWSIVAPGPAVQQWCGINPSPPGFCSVVDVGADWIEFDEDCYHCGITWVFQNLETGTIASEPRTDATHVLDLDASTLLRRVCAPVTAPENGAAVASGENNLISPVTFFGRFAVVGDPYTSRPGHLGRCGSRLRMRTSPLPLLDGNAQVLIGREDDGGIGHSGPASLTGIFLPSRQRFRIPLPSYFPKGMTGYALSDHHLYANDNAGDLWTAPAPSVPRRRLHHHHSR